MKDKVFNIFVWVFLGNFFIVISVVAGPIALPDSARPGAARPEPEEFDALPGSSIEIPEVVERPFDVDEGDTVFVTEFRLLDARDLPDFGISLQEIRSLLEDQRASMPKGFTIGQLQQVIDMVTDYYRSKGLILTQAVLPVQTVSSGIVDIQIFIGKLGRVLVEGNDLYIDNFIKKPFQDLIGQPVSQAKIEAALLTLTDYPGLTVFGVFQPGIIIGTADIVLTVQQEEKFDVAYRADTHGTRETGRNRLRATIDWNNITGFADRLTLSGQQTFVPANSMLVSLDYERFLADGFKIGGFLNRNTFDVGGEFRDSQISTETDNQNIFLEKSFIRSRQKNFSGRLDFTRKRSITNTAGTDTSRNILSVFSLGVDFDSVDTFSFSDEGGGINFGSVAFSQGLNNFLGSMGDSDDAERESVPPSRRGGDDSFAAGQFSKMFGSYTRLQTVSKNNSLLLKAEYQWSDLLLVPLEQYSVGGPNNVRAFSNARILWDRAYFLSLEWLINAPFFADKTAFGNRTWGELVQFSLFYDWARGRLNNPSQIDQQGYDIFDGVGLGLRFVLPGLIESKFAWATDVGSKKVGGDDEFQFWGDITYHF